MRGSGAARGVIGTASRRDGPGLFRPVRYVALALCFALVVAACGGDELSLTEYVELTNDAVALAEERATQFRREGVLAEDSTPRQVEDGLVRLLEEIRIPLQEAADAMDPPQQVAELHMLLWSWHASFIGVETTLAERVGATSDTEAGWALFSDSPEVAAYRASLAEGRQLCIDLQAHLDETEARGAFEDVPWLPSEMKEVVNIAVGCEGFPDDPQGVYRYSPP